MCYEAMVSVYSKYTVALNGLERSSYQKSTRKFIELSLFNVHPFNFM